MKRRYKSIVYIFLAVLVSSTISSVSTSYAQSSEDASTNPEAGVKFLTMEMPPYGLIDDDGHAAGAFYEISNNILLESGLEGRNLLSPIARMMKELERGRADCGIFGSTDYVRKQYNLVVGLGRDLHAGVVSMEERPLRQYQDLYGLRLGVATGIRLGDKFDQDTQLNKYMVKDYKLGSMMLLRGRVDAVAGVVESLRYLVKNLPETGDRKLAEPLIMKKIGLYLVCRKDFEDQATIAKLKSTVTTMREQDDFTQVFDFYFN